MKSLKLLDIFHFLLREKKKVFTKLLELIKLMELIELLVLTELIELLSIVELNCLL